MLFQQITFLDLKATLLSGGRSQPTGSRMPS